MKQTPNGRPHRWSHRAFDRSPISLFWSAALLAVGFVLVFLVIEFFLERFVEYGFEGNRRDLRLAIVLCLCAAYLPAISTYLARSALRTAAELMPGLESTGSMVSLETVADHDPSRLRAAGAVGVCLQFVTMALVELDFSDLAVVQQLSPEAYFHRLMQVWIGWFAGRVFYTTWIESRRFSKIGRERIKIDLLDLAAVAPLSQFGLRQALAMIGLLSIIAPMFYDSEAAPNLFWILVAFALLTLSLAVASLLIPVHGVQIAISDEKARELARINEQIRLALAPSGSPSQLGLADWIAYRGLVESAREWPVDAPILARFALYLAIPLGSGFGGALAERMVDTLLDLGTDHAPGRVRGAPSGLSF